MLALCLGVLAAWGATPGAPTGARSPSEALDGEVRCSSIADRAQPLVVDWNQDERAHVREAMASGLPVFRHDCGGLVLLRGCTARGAYGFVGSSRKEELVRLADKSEVVLNLPTFGASLARTLSSQERTLDIATVLVGMERTLHSSVSPHQLEGGAACAGATHFLRGAHVGAFALDLGVKTGAARRASSVFESRTHDGPLATRRDGDVRACNDSLPTAVRAPDRCSTLVRLELTRIGIEHGDDAADDFCPSGLVFAEGRCTLPTSAASHRCKKTDPGDCERQCRLGNVQSCATLSSLLGDGRGVEKNEVRAFELARKACDDASPDGCFLAGLALQFGRGVAKDTAEAVKAHERACDDGVLTGCWALGDLVRKGAGVPRDPARALALPKKACSVGLAIACIGLAKLTSQHDPKEGAALMARTCEAGHPKACAVLSAYYAEGTGVERDFEKATELASRACAKNDATGCFHLGLLHQKSIIATPDIAEARRLFEKACEMKEGPACNNLGVMYELGQGGSKDPAQGLAMHVRGCELGWGTSCLNAGLSHAQGKSAAPNGERAAHFFREGCDRGDAQSCSMLAECFKDGTGVEEDPKRAAELHRHACELGVRAPGG